jgi:hypothetical protein
MAPTFSKHGLSARQFCRNIAKLWQPAIAKRFASEHPFLGELLHGPTTAIRSRYHNPASLGAVNTRQNPNLPACSNVSAREMAHAPARCPAGEHIFNQDM